MEKKYKIRASTYSYVGVVKEKNEDSCYLGINEKLNVIFGLVADGMGGHEYGEIASNMVKEKFKKWFLNLKDHENVEMEDIENEWRNICRTVDEEIKIKSEQMNCHKFMGTTLTMILISETEYITFNIGDSRIYMKLKGESLVQLTKDQTLAQEKYEKGEISEEELNNPSNRDTHVLLQCIGGGAILEPVIDIGKIEEEYIVLLCSDGLCNRQNIKELENSLISKELNKKILKEITNNCINNGEVDNITGVIIRKEIV